MTAPMTPKKTMRNPPQRVLISGGAGFIGHRVSSLLAARGTHVGVIDSLASGLPMPQQTPHVTPFQHDIRDRAALAKTFNDFAPDAVIHLAALHHIPSCEANPSLAMDINITGTQCLLDAMQAQRVMHLVFASSAAVYDWQDSALNEATTPTRATDIYSLTKLTNEQQITLWAARTDSRAALARIFNVIGADDPNGHIIPDILRQLDVTQKTATIQLGNTAPRRDYTHADDTACGIVALLDHLDRGVPVEAYNLSYGLEYSVRDLVAAMGEILGLDITIATDPTRIRKIDRQHLLGDTAKTRNATGWRAEISFHHALRRILAELMPAHRFKAAS